MKMAGNTLEIDSFWGFTVQEILCMDYEALPETMFEASHMDDVAIVEYVTKVRQGTRSHAKTLACNRIISSMINGPDVLEC